LSDPIGLGAWMERHRASLNEYARGLGGDEDDVARAVQRTLDSEEFPANNDRLWRNWAERTIASVVYNRQRGERRAKEARETVGDIYSVGKITNHYWPAPLGEVYICPAGRCGRCGMILWLRLEREPGEPWYPVYGCASGHRQYNHQPRRPA